MSALLEKYKKVAGTSQASTIGLADWNGLLDDLSGVLTQLIQKGADFDAVSTVAIGVLLDRINDVLGPAYDQVAARGAQIEALYAQLVGTGLSADSVIESATRTFLTDARRAAIIADALTALRGGVQADGDTLAKLYAMLVAFKGTADAAHDSLGELAALIDANAAATTTALAAKADAAATTTALANRVRADAAQTFTTPQQRQAQTNIGASNGAKRQTVLSGPISSGLPAFYPASVPGSLTLTTQGLPANPLLVACAAGFDGAGPIDLIQAVAANFSVTLPASATPYVYIDYGTGATPSLTYGATTLGPKYQAGGTIDVTNGQFTFDMAPGVMVGWLGNGTTAVRCNRVFIAEAVTSASAITSVTPYAYNGRYRSGPIAFSGTALVTFAHNIGVPTEQIRGKGYIATATTGPWLADPLTLGSVPYPLFGVFGGVPRLAARATPNANGTFYDNGTNGGSVTTSGYLQWNGERDW